MNDIDSMEIPSDIEVEVASDDVREEEVAAADAERDLTHALAALKRRGEKVVTTVEGVLTPQRIAIGASVVIGVGAVVLLTRASRRGPRRPPSIAGAVAQSLAREVVGRLLLGAAATAGARLAEAAVPMIVASISARQAAQSRPARTRKRRSIRPTVAE